MKQIIKLLKKIWILISFLPKILLCVLKIVWNILKSRAAIFVYMSVWFSMIAINPSIHDNPLVMFDYVFGTICFSVIQIIGEFDQEITNKKLNDRIKKLEDKEKKTDEDTMDE